MLIKDKIKKRKMTLIKNNNNLTEKVGLPFSSVNYYYNITGKSTRSNFLVTPLFLTSVPKAQLY
jgi:hypothetical protein